MFGSLLQVLKTFRDQAIKLEFLVVKMSPIDVMIGLPTFLYVLANINFGAQRVRSHIGSEELVLTLERRLIRLRRSGSKEKTFETPANISIGTFGTESLESSEEEIAL